MTQIRKILVFLSLILSFASCDFTDDGPKTDIYTVGYKMLPKYLVENELPTDSLLRGITRYAMFSRVDKHPESVMCNLDNIYAKLHKKGSGDGLFTDIILAKAVVSADRLADTITLDYIRQAIPQIELETTPDGVMRRYTTAAYAALLTSSEEGNEMTINLCQNAIKFQRLHPECQTHPEIYNYLGQAAYENGETEITMTTISKALELAHTTGNKRQEARAYATLARGFRSEGLFLQEKMTAEKAFNLAKNIPVGETKTLAARVMGWAYEDQQQLDSALYYLNLAHKISDSVHLQSVARDILENDINRIKRNGCRQPDSTLASRAQYLQEYTKVLIDMGRVETLENDIQPALSRNRTIMFYAIGICLLISLLSLTGIYIFRNYQRKLHAEKDAHLEGIAARLRNVTSQYRTTSEKLEEVKSRLSSAEENREQLTQKILAMEDRLSDKEGELKDANTRLSNKQAFIASLQEEQKEQEQRMQEINRRFAHKEFNLEEAVSNPRHFARDFLAVHPDFERALKERSTNISSHDVLLCILIVLDVSKDNIASVLKIRPESLNVARHRLRTKLGLSRYDNLYTILRSHL